MPIDYYTTCKSAFERASNRCEFCKVKNHVDRWNGGKIISVVLSIVHLDYDPENLEVEEHRLAVLCQKCLTKYEKKKGDKNQTNLF